MKKTNKIIAKRMKIRKSKGKLKAFRKKSNKSHYLANDNGEERRNKRGMSRIKNKADERKIISLIR